jgi:Skp family chaperone for outer membrane proteins
LQEERRKAEELQEAVDSLSAENAELQSSSQRLAQLEPSVYFLAISNYIPKLFFTVLQKAGNLLREEQSRSSGLHEQVVDLESRLQEIPRQLQAIAALEAEKQAIESELTQRLQVIQASASI